MISIRGPIALAFALFLAGFAQAEPGVTDKEIVIGSCLPLSGTNAVTGRAYRDGVDAFFRQLDAGGGVHGRTIKYVVRDDGYEPSKAIECFKSLVDLPVFATGFASGSATSAKYVPMAETNHVPFFGCSAGPVFMYDASNEYVFAVRASYEDETSEEIDHLWKDLGVRKIAVLYQNDAFGVAGLVGVKRALMRYQTEPMTQASYERNTTDIEKAYVSIRDAHPEAVVLASVTVPAAAILKKAKADGWKPLFVMLAGHDALLVKEAGSAAEGVIVADTVPNLETKQPTVSLYLRSFKKYFPDRKPSSIGFEGFVDALIFSRGLALAGRDLTREGLVAALERLNGVGIGLGPDYVLDYAKGHHQAFKTLGFSVIRNGRSVALTDWKAQLKRSGP